MLSLTTAHHPHRTNITFCPFCNESNPKPFPRLHPSPHLGASTNASVVATEGNALLLQGHVLQVLGGLADVHALDGLGSLTSVLTRKIKTQLKAPLNTSHVPMGVKALAPFSWIFTLLFLSPRKDTIRFFINTNSLQKKTPKKEQ